jgi:hypothetical protein
MNLQSNYDLELAQDVKGAEISGRVWPPDKGNPGVHARFAHLR